jgi:hypothetical protein
MASPEQAEQFVAAITAAALGVNGCSTRARRVTPGSDGVVISVSIFGVHFGRRDADHGCTSS